MISAVTICNIALSHLGGASIASLDEQSEPARLCHLHYDTVLSALIDEHNWPHCSRFVRLAELPTSPPTWAHAYQRPADCIRVLEIVCGPGIAPIPFEIGGSTILTNQPDAWVKYVARVSDPALWPPLFVEAMSWKLAATLATKLTGVGGALNNCMQMYTNSLNKAKAAANNEFQGAPADDAPWIKEHMQ